MAVLRPGQAALPEGLQRWALGAVDVAVGVPPADAECLAAWVIALGRHHAEVEPVVPLRWGATAGSPAEAQARLAPLDDWLPRLRRATAGVEWGLVLPPVPPPSAGTKPSGPGAAFLARRRRAHAGALDAQRTRDAVVARVGASVGVGEASVDAEGRVRLPLLVPPEALAPSREALQALEAAWSGPWAPASFLAR